MIEGPALPTNKNMESLIEPYEKGLIEALKLNNEYNNWIKKQDEFIKNDRELNFSQKLLEKNERLNTELHQRSLILRQNGIKNVPDFNSKESLFKLSKVLKVYGYKDKIEANKVTNRIWITLEKGRMKFLIKYNLQPVIFGLGGKSRIELIEALRMNGKGEYDQISYFDKEWLRASEDKETQKEIDFIQAVLG